MLKRIKWTQKSRFEAPLRTLYVGRPSKWGNPFKIGSPDEDGHPMSRETVIAKFEEYAIQNGIFVAAKAVMPQYDYIGCWCRLDEACHADLYVEIVNNYLHNT